MVFVAPPHGWSYFRASLFDLHPLNRQAVVENTADAVFVFDANDNLRNSNVHARRLVGLDPSVSVEGQPAETVFGDHPTLLDIYRARRAETSPAERTEDSVERLLESAESIADGDAESTLVQLSDEGEPRYYDFRVSSIRSSTDELTGRVVVARDVTVRRRQREMLEARTTDLERQNERLDRFASMVSHDLRNPLNVAQGRITLIARDTDTEHVESARDALARMETMIEDVLALARAGQTIEEPEECLLADVVTDAWANVQAEGSHLEEGLEQATIEADRNRLLHVFGNLFRNAVDHNEPPLTVRVGLLDGADGFYVEDTGGGVPDEQTVIFDHGYTTNPLRRDSVTRHDTISGGSGRETGVL